MEKYRWQDAPIKMHATARSNADPASTAPPASAPPVSVCAALKGMNAANREFWDGRTEDAEVRASAEGTPAAIAAMNERNRRFWQGRP